MVDLRCGGRQATPCVPSRTSFVGPLNCEGQTRLLCTHTAGLSARIARVASVRWRHRNPRETVELSTMELIVEHRVVVVCAEATVARRADGAGGPRCRGRRQGPRDIAPRRSAATPPDLLLLVDVERVYPGGARPEQHLASRRSTSNVARPRQQGRCTEDQCRCGFIEAGAPFAGIGACVTGGGRSRSDPIPDTASSSCRRLLGPACSPTASTIDAQGRVVTLKTSRSSLSRTRVCGWRWTRAKA